MKLSQSQDQSEEVCFSRVEKVNSSSAQDLSLTFLVKAVVRVAKGYCLKLLNENNTQVTVNEAPGLRV